MSGDIYQHQVQYTLYNHEHLLALYYTYCMVCNSFEYLGVLMHQSFISHTQQIDEIVHLLNNLPDGSSVVVTSPDKIIKELFTHQG